MTHWRYFVDFRRYFLGIIWSHYWVGRHFLSFPMFSLQLQVALTFFILGAMYLVTMPTIGFVRKLLLTGETEKNLFYYFSCLRSPTTSRCTRPSCPCLATWWWKWASGHISMWNKHCFFPYEDRHLLCDARPPPLHTRWPLSHPLHGWGGGGRNRYGVLIQGFF